jgi:hypothetical protein
MLARASWDAVPECDLASAQLFELNYSTILRLPSSPYAH